MYRQHAIINLNLIREGIAMMKKEFECRVNFVVSNREYEAIEILYMSENNNLKINKDDFCKQWIDNGGVVESVCV